MKTLLFERNLPRFAAARVASAFGSGRGAGVGPLRLVDTEPPALPGAGWHRVTPLLSGICGSDLATLDGRSSRYFEDLVSFPFVPGHEVVGRSRRRRPEGHGRHRWPPGPGWCSSRSSAACPGSIDPPCPACAEGRTGDCERVAFGHLRPGLQTGFCADTGGGWSAAGLVAHPSQLHVVPDRMDDEDAVMVEPVACAVHAVLSAGVRDGDDGGRARAPAPSGLAAVAALAHLAATGRTAPPGRCWSAPATRTSGCWPPSLGATAALPPDQLPRAVRRRSSSLALGAPDPGGQRLTGGADVVLDCVGSLGVDRPGPGHGPTPGAGGPGRHARPGPGRPGLPLAPRGPPGRRLRLRRRAGRRPDRRCALSTWPSRWSPRSAPDAWCPPPTRWSASRRRWPTPARPAGGAP